MMKKILTFALAVVSGFAFYTGATYEKQDLTTKNIVVNNANVLIDPNNTNVGFYDGYINLDSSEADTTFYKDLDLLPIYSSLGITFDDITSFKVVEAEVTNGPGWSVHWQVLANFSSFGTGNFVENVPQVVSWDVLPKITSSSEDVSFAYECDYSNSTRLKLSYRIDYDAQATYQFDINSITIPNTYIEGDSINVVINTTNPDTTPPQAVTINDVVYNDTQFTYNADSITVPVVISDVSDTFSLVVNSIQAVDTVITLDETISITNETPKEVDSGSSVYFLNGGFDVTSVTLGDQYNLEIQVDVSNTDFYPAEIGLDGKIYEFDEADFTHDTSYTIQIPFTSNLSYGAVSHHVEYVILRDSSNLDRVLYDAFDNGGLGWQFELSTENTFTDGISASGVVITESQNTAYVTDLISIEVFIPDYATLALDYDLAKVKVNGMAYPIDSEDIVDNKIALDIVTSSNPSDAGKLMDISVQGLIFEKNFGTEENPDIQEDHMPLNYNFQVELVSPLNTTGLVINNAFFDRELYLSNEQVILNIFVNNPNEYDFDHVKLANGLVIRDFGQLTANGMTTLSVPINVDHRDYTHEVEISELKVMTSYNGTSFIDYMNVSKAVSTEIVNYFFDENVDFDRTNNQEIYIATDYVFTGDVVSIYFPMVNPDDVGLYQYVVNGRTEVIEVKQGNLYRLDLEPFTEPGTHTVVLEKVITENRGLTKEKVINESIVIEVYDSEFALDTSVLSFTLASEDPIYYGDTARAVVAYNTANPDLAFRSITLNGIEYREDAVTTDPIEKKLYIDLKLPSEDSTKYQITEMSFTWQNRVGVRTDYNKNLSLTIGDNYDRIQDDVLQGNDSWLFDKIIPFWDNSAWYVRGLIITFAILAVVVPIGIANYERFANIRLTSRIANRFRR